MARPLNAAVLIVALLASSPTVAAQVRFRRGDPAPPVTAPIRDSPATGHTDGSAAEPSSSAVLRAGRLKFVEPRRFDQRRFFIPFGLGGGWFYYLPLWDSINVTDGATTAAPHGAPFGGVQLDVEPRGAEVYVDGVYAGVVSEFSGYYQHLDLGAGPHVITIIARDYEPLIVHLVVSPYHVTTYRNALTRAYRR